MVRVDDDPDIVRSQLSRILRSPAFDASERNCRFLKYVVEEALAGRASRLKAYTVATRVLGRDSNFDPQNDPIVRVEAGRLRRSLDHYYLSAGKNDNLVISIPKGGYAPLFQTKKADQTLASDDIEQGWAETDAEPTGPSSSGPVIYVAAIEQEGDHSAFPNFTNGFTRALIVRLTRFSELAVYGAETSLSHGPDVSLDKLRTDLGVDFIVKGGAAISAGRFDVDVLLIDAKSGQSLWAETFSRKLTPHDIVSARDDVANSIARALAQPFGVIFGHQAREAEGKQPDDLESFDAVIKYYLFLQHIDRDIHTQARFVLERAVSRNPDYSEAFACLSRVYTDCYRFGFESGLGNNDPRDRALELARRAIELAPSSSWAHKSLGLAYWFLGDAQSSLSSLETALSLNPNDTEIMADLGLHYIKVLEWDKGVPLLEEAYRRNPSLPGTYRVGLWLFHLAHGRYQDALMEARKTQITGVVYGYLFEAAAAAGLGLQEETESALSAVAAIDPNYGYHIVADLQKRHTPPEMIELIVDLLARAGLPGCEHGAKIKESLRIMPAESA